MEKLGLDKVRYSVLQLDMQVGYSLISEKIKVTNPGPNYHLSLISRYK